MILFQVMVLITYHVVLNVASVRELLDHLETCGGGSAFSAL